MNIKKTGGGGSASEADVRGHVEQCGHLLREQINLLDATLVVCCGSFRFIRPMLRIDRQLGERAIRSGGRLWLDSFHPSAMLSHSAMYDRLMGDFQEALR